MDVAYTCDVVVASPQRSFCFHQRSTVDGTSLRWTSAELLAHATRSAPLNVGLGSAFLSGMLDRRHPESYALDLVVDLSIRGLWNASVRDRQKPGYLFRDALTLTMLPDGFESIAVQYEWDSSHGEACYSEPIVEPGSWEFIVPFGGEHIRGVLRFLMSVLQR